MYRKNRGVLAESEIRRAVKLRRVAAHFYQPQVRALDKPNFSYGMPPEYLKWPGQVLP